MAQPTAGRGSNIAVAHKVSPSAEPALRFAIHEADLRGVTLEVIHVVDSFDADVTEATRAGVGDAVEKVVNDCHEASPTWTLHEVAGGHDVSGVAQAILAKVDELGSQMLVIGARRRSPVGKALLGSVTQSVILQADVPVLIVKEER